MFKPGNLLISEPFLPDPNFARSVVLICEHGSEGSVGFVLNQLASIVLSDLSEDFSGLEELVYVGGPVEQNTLHFIHTLGNKIESSVQISDRLFWSGQINTLLDLIKMSLVNDSQYRFFLGYSGWEAGQLDREYDQKSWILADKYDYNPLELKSENLWREILKRKGGSYKAMAHYPVDPRLN